MASLRCLLAAAALTACGATATSSGPGAAPRPATGTAAPAAPRQALAASAAPSAPAVRTPGTPARGAAPAARGTATAGAAAPGTDPSLPSGLPSSAPLRVRLASTCVTPGGEQSVVVETLPDAYVAFDNLYPDGRTGAVHGGHEASGRTGADGRFTAAWRIAPGTPEGRVRVDVGVSARDGSAITMAYYQLATRC